LIDSPDIDHTTAESLGEIALISGNIPEARFDRARERF
jgi:hypothetical protein